MEKDRAILQAVCDCLREREQLAEPIAMVDEERLDTCPVDAATYISMARGDAALSLLARMEARGCRVVNSVAGVRGCQRTVLDRLMRENHIAMPPLSGGHGYWLKRGDAAAQEKRDVVYCADEAALEVARHDFLERGIGQQVVSSHVVGDLVKFYGVAGSDFFRCYYPGDDGISKFGDEARNGRPHHYAYSQAALQREVARLAALVGTTVYGGDAVGDAAGRFYIIDFNDWPSFSRCREEAARAIAAQI